MHLKREALLVIFHLWPTFLFSTRCGFCRISPASRRPFGLHSLGREASIKPDLHTKGALANKEVIREDKSGVFTLLLCNNKDRVQRSTKRNDGLYRSPLFGLRCCERTKIRRNETLLDPAANCNTGFNFPLKVKVHLTWPETQSAEIHSNAWMLEDVMDWKRVFQCFCCLNADIFMSHYKGTKSCPWIGSYFCPVMTDYLYCHSHKESCLLQTYFCVLAAFPPVSVTWPLFSAGWLEFI